MLRLHDRQLLQGDNSVIWVGEASTSKGYADKREAVDYLLVEIKTQDPRLKTQDSRHVYLVCCLESAEELSPSRN